jgi:hypothetical protein
VPLASYVYATTGKKLIKVEEWGKRVDFLPPFLGLRWLLRGSRLGVVLLFEGMGLGPIPRGDLVSPAANRAF